MAQGIDKSEWANYCERLSELLATTDAEIEVAALELGDQVQTEWLPFYGISYDAEDDIIDVELEGVDHIINHPQALSTDENFAGLLSIQIKDADGIQHMVRLKDRLALPGH
jgi:hypothetical protein